MVWGLRYGEKGDELCGFEVYDIVVVLVCDTEVVAASLRQTNTRWKWDFLQPDVKMCYSCVAKIANALSETRACREGGRVGLPGV